MRLIDEGYTRRSFYGSRRMMQWLHEQGYQVGRHRVRRSIVIFAVHRVGQRLPLGVALDAYVGSAHKIQARQIWWVTSHCAGSG